MTDNAAIKILEDKLKYIATLRLLRYDSQEFKQWKRDTIVALKRIFADDNEDHAKEFESIKYYPFSSSMDGGDADYYEAHLSGLDSAEAKLKSMIKEIKDYGLTANEACDADAPSFLPTLFKKFDGAARQLGERHGGRSTLEIKDEYDVQDFLHVLLKLYFDDIRPEEWTPSCAGNSSRMDFLLTNKQTAIETKKTREGLADKEIRNQLILDIHLYRTHPTCKSLICFVYDPERRIKNPIALENDLSKSEEGFKVTVIVQPK